MSKYDIFAEKRKLRLQALLEMVKRNEGISVKKLRGLFCLKTGLSPKIFHEYLGILKDAELIEEKNGKISYKVG